MNPYIIEYLHQQPYVAVVIGISYEGPVSYISKVGEELKKQSVQGLILFDMLLYSGNGQDRFFEIKFNGEKFQTESARTVRLERLTPLRKRTCEIIGKNPQYVENSILNSQQKALIKHGCCI